METTDKTGDSYFAVVSSVHLSKKPLPVEIMAILSVFSRISFAMPSIRNDTSCIGSPAFAMYSPFFEVQITD